MLSRNTTVDQLTRFGDGSELRRCHLLRRPGLLVSRSRREERQGTRRRGGCIQAGTTTELNLRLFPCQRHEV